MAQRPPGRPKSKKFLETTLGKAPAVDLSHVRRPIDTSVFGLNQVLQLLNTATDEVQRYIKYECDIMYECKTCRTIFRSLANFVLHKRNYCQENYKPHDHCRNSCLEGGYNIIQDEECESEYSETSSREATPQPMETRSTALKPDRKKLTSVINKLVRRQEGTKITEEALDENSPVSSSQCISGAKKINDIILEPIEGSSAGVFQTMFKTMVEEQRGTDFMKDEVMEIHHILNSDEAIIGEDGKVLDNVNLKNATPNTSGTKLICSVCNLKFSTKKTLTYHVKYKHNKSKIVFPCPICQDTFANAWGVFRHLYKVHRKTNAQIRKMRGHIHSSGVRKDQKLKKKSNILVELGGKSEEKQWMDNIEGDNDFQMCGGCGKRFERKAALHSHSQICHKRIAVCNSIKENAAKRALAAEEGRNISSEESGASRTSKRKRGCVSKKKKAGNVKVGKSGSGDRDGRGGNKKISLDDEDGTNEFQNSTLNDVVVLLNRSDSSSGSDTSAKEQQKSKEKKRQEEPSEKSDRDSDDCVEVIDPKQAEVIEIDDDDDDEEMGGFAETNGETKECPESVVFVEDSHSSNSNHLDGGVESHTKAPDKRSPLLFAEIGKKTAKTEEEGDVICVSPDYVHIKESGQFFYDNGTNCSSSNTSRASEIKDQNEDAGSGRSLEKSTKQVLIELNSELKDALREIGAVVMKRKQVHEPKEEDNGKRRKSAAQIALEEKAKPYMDAESFVCLPCALKFTNSRCLMDHMARHFNWYCYQCTKCIYMSNSVEELISHAKRQHQVHGKLDNIVLPIPNWKTIDMATDFMGMDEAVGFAKEQTDILTQKSMDYDNKTTTTTSEAVAEDAENSDGVNSVERPLRKEENSDFQVVVETVEGNDSDQATAEEKNDEINEYLRSNNQRGLKKVLREIIFGADDATSVSLAAEKTAKSPPENSNRPSRNRTMSVQKDFVYDLTGIGMGKEDVGPAGHKKPKKTYCNNNNRAAVRSLFSSNKNNAKSSLKVYAKRCNQKAAVTGEEKLCSSSSASENFEEKHDQN